MEKDEWKGENGVRGSNRWEGDGVGGIKVEGGVKREKRGKECKEVECVEGRWSNGPVD